MKNKIGNVTVSVLVNLLKRKTKTKDFLSNTTHIVNTYLLSRNITINSLRLYVYE